MRGRRLILNRLELGVVRFLSIKWVYWTMDTGILDHRFCLRTSFILIASIFDLVAFTLK